MNPFTFLVLGGAFMSISFTLMISLKYGGITEMMDSVKKYKLPLTMTALLTLGYRITFYVSLVMAPVSLAQPMRNTLFVVITVVFAGLLFKEKHIARKLGLSLLLLLFAYLLTLNI